MIHSNTSDFHFSWNQMPNAIGRFPFLQLAWLELAVAMVTPVSPHASTGPVRLFVRVCAHGRTDSSQFCLVWKSAMG